MLIINYKLPSSVFLQQLVFDGRLYPDIIDYETITTEWNGQTLDVQHIYYEVFRMECEVRESEFQALQTLRFAHEIKINYNNEGFINYFFQDIRIENIFNEYKKVVLTFKKSNNKVISNKLITGENYGRLDFNLSGFAVQGKLIFLEPIKIAEIERNTIDNFEKLIQDYSKLRTSYQVRMFFNELDYFSFLSNLQNMKATDYMRLVNLSLNFTEFEILNNEKVSNDLYLIEIKLIQSTNVKSIY